VLIIIHFHQGVTIVREFKRREKEIKKIHVCQIFNIFKKIISEMSLKKKELRILKVLYERLMMTQCEAKHEAS